MQHRYLCRIGISTDIAKKKIRLRHGYYIYSGYLGITNPWSGYNQTMGWLYPNNHYIYSNHDAVYPNRRRPLREDASPCQVAISDNELSGIDKGLRKTNVLSSLLVIETYLLIKVAESPE
jgi:hypothetical protein